MAKLPTLTEVFRINETPPSSGRPKTVPLDVSRVQSTYPKAWKYMLQDMETGGRDVEEAIESGELTFAEGAGPDGKKTLWMEFDVAPGEETFFWDPKARNFHEWGYAPGQPGNS